MVCRWADELSILSVDSDGAVEYCGRWNLPVLWRSRCFSSRRQWNFIWVVLAVLGLVPAAVGRRYVSRRLTGAALALGAGAC